MTLKTTLTATTAALALVAAPAAVMAQSADATQPEATQEAPAKTYSEAELENFVDAALQVAEVRSTYMPQLQSAGSDSEVQKLQTEARDEMVSAIEETEGMDLETYTEIGQSAQNDPELNQKLTALIQDRMPESAQQQQQNDG